MSKGLIRGKKDSRRFSRHKYFGSIGLPDLPLEFLKNPYPKTYSQGATLFCTGYTVAAMLESRYGIPFSPDRFAEQEAVISKQAPHFQGCTLAVQTQAIKNCGVLPQTAQTPTWQANGWDKVTDPATWNGVDTSEEPKYKQPSYFVCDGPYDHFDNLRVGLFQQDATNEGASVGVDWYAEWGITDKTGIVDTPSTVGPSAHNIRVFGWKQINGQPYLAFDPHEGPDWGDQGIGYMSREIANKVIYTNDGPYIFMDNDPAEVKKTLWTALDYFLNFLSKLFPKVSNHPTPPMPTPPVLIPPVPPLQLTPIIHKWAECIRIEEGGGPNDPNTLLNNPGNLKFTSLTASWGGTIGQTAKDGGSLCHFKDEATGMQALINFLTLGVDDELKAFRNSRTLRLFTRTYACPPDDGYAKRVAAKLRVSVDVDISTFKNA